MLKSLYIKNYALIDSLEIDFESGFSVITGETGAGKSIILGALGLILGQRADMKAIKQEEQNYVPMPVYYSFIDKAGINRKEEVLMTNFRKINKEVELIVNENIKTA